MTPKITPSQNIDHRALALIDRRVSEMDHVYHERPRDFGIDGEIAVRDLGTRALTGAQVLFQSKGSTRRFAGETDHSFSYTIERRHLQGWLASRIPVILICSHPDSQEAWFKSIHQWFVAPERIAARRVDFDKDADRFDASAAAALAHLAASKHEAPQVLAPRIPEMLRSNLLPVESWPDTVYKAPCPVDTPGDVWRLLRENDDDPPGDWRLRSGLIESFRPLDTGVLRAAVSGPVQRLAADEWAYSEDPDEEYGFSELLGRTLQEMHRDDLAWHRERKFLYFRATDDLSAKSVAGAREHRSVTVFTPYPSKKDRSRIGYYRHAALRRRFLRIGDEWFMTVIPTYHFTFDGHRESFWAADMLSGIKRRDRNDAVRRWGDTWARYLSGSDTTMSLLPQERPIRFGPLREFQVEYGIDDRAWARPRSTTTPGDLSLLDAA